MQSAKKQNGIAGSASKQVLLMRRSGFGLHSKTDLSVMKVCKIKPHLDVVLGEAVRGDVSRHFRDDPAGLLALSVWSHRNSLRNVGPMVTTAIAKDGFVPDRASGGLSWCTILLSAVDAHLLVTAVVCNVCEASACTAVGVVALARLCSHTHDLNNPPVVAI